MAELSFTPADLSRHSKKCVEFRADSFAVSFGDDSKFYEEDGKGAERYLDWLKAKIEKDPNSVVHVWSNDEIVGQLELGQLRDDPSRGYVNLYYLAPLFRGMGLGAALDAHASAYFRSRGLKVARLSVSPMNRPAMAFYLKCGWRDLGPRPEHPEVHFMEKDV